MDFIVSWLSFMLSSASLFFALGAVIFWARSAFVRIPLLPETALSGPKSVTGIMQRQSTLNANAAACAAASAVAQIILKTI